MDPERRPTRSTRLAPLAQAGLAALVAGSLLTFSALAFNTAFEGRGPAEVTAAAPETAAPRPVVLPGTPAPTRPGTASTEDRVAQVEAPTQGDVVLGTQNAGGEPAPTESTTSRSPKPGRAQTKQVGNGSKDFHEDSHRHGNAYGHIEARGKGHQRGHRKGHHNRHHNHDGSGSATKAKWKRRLAANR